MPAGPFLTTNIRPDKYGSYLNISSLSEKITILKMLNTNLDYFDAGERYSHSQPHPFFNIIVTWQWTQASLGPSIYC